MSPTTPSRFWFLENLSSRLPSGVAWREVRNAIETGAPISAGDRSLAVRSSDILGKFQSSLTGNDPSQRASVALKLQSIIAALERTSKLPRC
jgi:hypothetical protein